jgi:hypothetical protein
MGVTALAVALGLVLSAPAAAQTGPAPAQPSSTAASASSGGDYQGDFFGGVSLINRVRNRGENTTYQPGWQAGASYRIIHVISLVGEASGDYDKRDDYTAHIYAFSGGVRFQSAAKHERVKPFALLMLGTATDNGTGTGTGTGTSNHYAVVTPGGGVDLGVADHLALRLRLDFPLYTTFGDTHKGARVSVGIAVPLGSS